MTIWICPSLISCFRQRWPRHCFGDYGRHYGLDDTIISWFLSYLHGCVQMSVWSRQAVNAVSVALLCHMNRILDWFSFSSRPSTFCNKPTRRQQPTPPQLCERREFCRHLILRSTNSATAYPLVLTRLVSALVVSKSKFNPVRARISGNLACRLQSVITFSCFRRRSRTASRSW